MLRGLLHVVAARHVGGGGGTAAARLVWRSSVPLRGLQGARFYNHNAAAAAAATDTATVVRLSAAANHGTTAAAAAQASSSSSQPLPLVHDVTSSPLASRAFQGGTCTGNSKAVVLEPTTFDTATTTTNSSTTTAAAGTEQADDADAIEYPTSVSGRVRYMLEAYASLSKWKLSALVLATTMWGYAMAPGALAVAPLSAALVGTGLTIASAATINQIMEIDNDARMYRTRKRWLPAGRIGTTHAAAYAAVAGTAGVGSLYCLANPVAAALALSNLVLYTAIYTPMKQQRPLNTYVGAIVGAVPPMIGWAACSPLAPGAWVLGGLLAVWQIPHFMALSWSLKDDYARGGFKMLINVEPESVPAVVLAYSLLMSTIGVAAAATDVTTWAFALDSMIPNGLFTYEAYKFYQNPSRESARKVFRYSLLILPVLMAMMSFHKKHPVVVEQHVPLLDDSTSSSSSSTTATTAVTTAAMD